MRSTRRAKPSGVRSVPRSTRSWILPLRAPADTPSLIGGTRDGRSACPPSRAGPLQPSPSSVRVKYWHRRAHARYLRTPSRVAASSSSFRCRATPAAHGAVRSDPSESAGVTNPGRTHEMGSGIFPLRTRAHAGATRRPPSATEAPPPGPRLLACTAPTTRRPRRRCDGAPERGSDSGAAGRRWSESSMRTSDSTHRLAMPASMIKPTPSSRSVSSSAG